MSLNNLNKDDIQEYNYQMNMLKRKMIDTEEKRRFHLASKLPKKYTFQNLKNPKIIKKVFKNSIKGNTTLFDILEEKDLQPLQKVVFHSNKYFYIPLNVYILTFLLTMSVLFFLSNLI